MSVRNLDNDGAVEFYRSFLEFYCSWFPPESYLEIGLNQGETFRRLIPYCVRLTGVDPNLPKLGNINSKCRLVGLSSDQYFLQHSEDRHDLVFIDGFHEAQQVMRDIRNSLQCLSQNGVIMAHDTFPPSPDFTNPEACGDAYKAMIELRKDRSIEVYTFPVRYGLSVIGKVGTAFPWVPH